MKLILHLVKFDWPGGPEQLGLRLSEIAAVAEQSGFDGISISDHLWLHPRIGGPDGNMLEAYTTLAFLAAHTHRGRLLTQVTAVPYRYPGVLAKTVTTLDVLSGGRACLGVALVLMLWVIAVMALVARVNPILALVGLVWGLIVPILGITQFQLLPGSLHWIIEALHLLVGIIAIALANILARQIAQTSAMRKSGALVA